jgi:hypothetical protein
MHRMLFCALVALAMLLSVPHAARAQAAFTNGYLEWGLRPDVPRVPYDGAPYSEKYHTAYYNVAPLMFGASASQLWEMYWLDRIDRAERFGYELPPYVDYGAPVHPRPGRIGLGLGFFRCR